MKESARAIVAQESIRAGFLALILIPVWGFLVIRQAVPPGGASFLAVVAGVPLVVFGMVAGLRAATGWHLLAPEPRSQRRWEGTLAASTLWVLVSLLAIAVIVEQPVLGLAVALVGGAVLGVMLVRNFEASGRE